MDFPINEYQVGLDMNSWLPSIDQEQKSQILLDEKLQKIKEALEKAKIDPNCEPEVSPSIISFGDAQTATLGNFSCVVGKAKSRKTFFITAIISALLNGFWETIKTQKIQEKDRIIWFDTEQSQYHIYKSLKRALTISTYEREAQYSLEVYSLRSYAPEMRKAMIEVALDQENPNNDIAFVVIDGIRDLITDINDAVQATDISTWLLRLTEIKKIHICTVLHQNKRDNNPRGHIGTEIMNKAESVISVEKVNDKMSLVSAEYCRDKAFDQFAFVIDHSGIPLLVEYEKSEDTIKKKLMPMDVAEKVHQDVLHEVFKDEKEFSRSDLMTRIKLEYHKYNVFFGDSKAREFLSFWLSRGYIKHNDQKSSKARYILV